VISTGLSVLASMAGDMGVPGASAVSAYLSPPTLTDWVREGLANLQTHRAGVAEYRHELEQFLLAVSGHEQCAQLLACTAAAHAARLPGAGAWAFLLGSQTSHLPQYIVNLVDVFRLSVMLGDDCSQYRCKDDISNKTNISLIQPRRRRQLILSR